MQTNNTLKHITQNRNYSSLWRGNLASILRAYLTSFLNIFFRVESQMNASRHRVLATLIKYMGAIFTILVVYPLKFARVALAADAA